MNIKKWAKWGTGLFSVGILAFFTGLINNQDKGISQQEMISSPQTKQNGSTLFEWELAKGGVLGQEASGSLGKEGEFVDPREEFYASLDWGEDVVLEERALSIDTVVEERVVDLQSYRSSQTTTRGS